MGRADPPHDALLARARVASPLRDVDLHAAGAELVLVEWSDAGGGDDPPRWLAPLHLHHADDEAWYVLEGTLGFRIGDAELEAAAGDAVLVPRGVPHTFCNARPTPARFVVVMTSRIKAIIDGVAQLEEPSDAAIAALFDQHGGRYLGRP